MPNPQKKVKCRHLGQKIGSVRRLWWHREKEWRKLRGKSERRARKGGFWERNDSIIITIRFIYSSCLQKSGRRMRERATSVVKPLLQPSTDHRRNFTLIVKLKYKTSKALDFSRWLDSSPSVVQTVASVANRFSNLLCQSLTVRCPSSLSAKEKWKYGLSLYREKKINHRPYSKDIHHSVTQVNCKKYLFVHCREHETDVGG